MQCRSKLLETESFDNIMVPGDQVEPASAVLLLRDGGEVELRRRPLLVAGRVAGQVWSCTNTTERRLAELRELELQRRLWDARKLTDLGLLAAGIAHDFNNLLTVVRASAAVAQGMLASDHPVQEVLDDMTVCSETGATLVAQILEFSRQEKERPRSQNLGKLVKDSMRLLKLMAPRSLEIHLRIEDTRCHVIVHPAQLTQVLLNLGVNAVQAMKGRGRITIAVGPLSEGARAKAGPRAGEFVELSVADSGAGMDPAIAGRLFEPFFTTKGPGQGTGIGLTTVQQIVADLGGWIVVESALGTGTVFRVVLPTTVQDAPVTHPDAKTQSNPVQRGQGPDEKAEPPAVLVIEPQVDEREKLEACLAEVGYEPFVFPDGAAAVEKMSEERAFDVAVVGRFGSAELACELGRVLRALRSDLPIVFTSFLDYSHFLSTSANASRCAVLSRPYGSDTLAQLLYALIREV